MLGEGTGSAGSGMAANAAGEVLIAPDGNGGPLWSVDVVDGIVTETATLSGGTEHTDEINAMTWLQGTLYTVESSDDGSPASPANLISIDPATGFITVIGELPTGIDALASALP